jgi:hypothetical protein
LSAPAVLAMRASDDLMDCSSVATRCASASVAAAEFFCAVSNAASARDFASRAAAFAASSR